MSQSVSQPANLGLGLGRLESHATVQCHRLSRRFQLTGHNFININFFFNVFSVLISIANATIVVQGPTRFETFLKICGFRIGFSRRFWGGGEETFCQISRQPLTESCRFFFVSWLKTAGFEPANTMASSKKKKKTLDKYIYTFEGGHKESVPPFSGRKTYRFTLDVTLFLLRRRETPVFTLDSTPPHHFLQLYIVYYNSLDTYTAQYYRSYQPGGKRSRAGKGKQHTHNKLPGKTDADRGKPQGHSSEPRTYRRLAYTTWG